LFLDGTDAIRVQKVIDVSMGSVVKLSVTADIPGIMLAPNPMSLVRPEINASMENAVSVKMIVNTL